MCSRGIFQLKYLQIFYCDYGGSSEFIRNFIPTLLAHPLLNKPKIDVQLYIKKNKHPLLNGIYINGYQKSISLKGLKESEEILDRISLLRNSFGTQSIRHAGRKVITLTPSIQGGWNENLFNKQNFPQHEMENSHSFPHIEIPAPIILPVDKPLDVNKRLNDAYQLFQKPRLGVRNSTNM